MNLTKILVTVRSVIVQIHLCRGASSHQFHTTCLVFIVRHYANDCIVEVEVVVTPYVLVRYCSYLLIERWYDDVNIRDGNELHLALHFGMKSKEHIVVV